MNLLTRKVESAANVRVAANEKMTKVIEVNGAIVANLCMSFGVTLPDL